MANTRSKRRQTSTSEAERYTTLLNEVTALSFEEKQEANRGSFEGAAAVRIRAVRSRIKTIRFAGYFTAALFLLMGIVRSLQMFEVLSYTPPADPGGQALFLILAAGSILQMSRLAKMERQLADLEAIPGPS